ncbi:aspartate/glutamate racemase family protein [Salinispirillum marinum]|uniref:Aspartate/glutamate racemase family protein n=2 Tax=Saccharospirillaceae TaxID=255527 RepID=A0ABV8BI16_9GAMM
MKTLGLLGGMSWESTQHYYRALNEGVKQTLGGLHSAKLVLYSVDFAEIERLQHQGNWAETAVILAAAAQSVERAGAEGLLICTNTMHKVADDIQAAITIPLLHIADATGEALQRDGIKQVGLLGTAFTMEQAFYKDRLEKRFGLTVRVPNPNDRADVHRIIYDELCRGKVLPESRTRYLTVMDELYEDGAQAIILGCTEIAMLVGSDDTDIPLYDTTALHANAAVTWALS